MKIKVNKSILLEALQLVVSISPKTTSEPVISNVLISAASDQVEDAFTIKATNYDKSFSGIFSCEVLEQGEICINTAKLFSLVREFRGESIIIETTPQNWVYLVCEKSKVKLPGVETDLFPVIEFSELRNKITVKSKEFKRAIDLTYYSIGENDSRKNLMGLNLKTTPEGDIRWIGADGFRICQVINKADGDSPEGNIIIPKSSLPDIKKLLDYKDEEILINFDDNNFQIISEQIKFKTRLIEADYPDLGVLINTKGNINLKLPKKELINAVRILNTVTDSELNAIMKLTAIEGKVTLQSQQREFGEGNDEIDCNYLGEEVQIGLNIKFFLESLSIFDSAPDEFINLSFSGPISPFVITCDEWVDYKTILMPVKIKW